VSTLPDREPGPRVGLPSHGNDTYVVSAVVPTFNAMRFLDNCLGSVLAAARRRGAVEIILVDNGSTDGTWRAAQERQCDWVDALQIPGVTIGTLRNRGAARARGRYLAFLDADCEVPSDYFLAVERVLSSGACEASGSAVALPGAPHWIERVWHDLHRRSAGHAPKYINSGNLVVTREAFRQVGGFREDIITDEDVDFCSRLARAGFRFREDPSITAMHHGNPKSLTAFARREAWHAIGNGERGRVSWDLPNVMALAHLLCSVTALVVAVYGAGLPAAARLGVALAGQGLIPLVAVCYRVLRGGKVESLPAALLLYHLYFDARVAAAMAALADRRRTANMLRGSATVRESTESEQRSRLG
jgi:glycosyltransferase involved in cell wall biosynthesis